jgi:hypothetical protein
VIPKKIGIPGALASGRSRHVAANNFSKPTNGIVIVTSEISTVVKGQRDSVSERDRLFKFLCELFGAGVVGEASDE